MTNTLEICLDTVDYKVEALQTTQDGRISKLQETFTNDLKVLDKKVEDLQANQEKCVSKLDENSIKELDEKKARMLVDLNNLNKLLDELVEDQNSDRKSFNTQFMGLWILSGINCLIVFGAIIFLLRHRSGKNPYNALEGP